jgi:hypothetical protein
MQEIEDYLKAEQAIKQLIKEWQSSANEKQKERLHLIHNFVRYANRAINAQESLITRCEQYVTSNIYNVRNQEKSEETWRNMAEAYRRKLIELGFTDTAHLMYQ